MSDGANIFDSTKLPELCEKIFESGGYAGILPNFEHSGKHLQAADPEDG